MLDKRGDLLRDPEAALEFLRGFSGTDLPKDRGHRETESGDPTDDELEDRRGPGEDPGRAAS
ncbi:hypothetical protein [Saccharopolyspora taberi]|uniref:hypothetical protein n=1 Tax=Saccharopolyspora taberi TaxID=60895 RepID=UPI0031D78E0F